MALLETLNELKEFISKNGINKEQFTTKLLDAMTKAVELKPYVDDIKTFDDMVTLIAYRTADGDANLASLVGRLVFEYVIMARDLGKDNATYLKEAIVYYLQK